MDKRQRIGGRQKGTPNKITNEIREILNRLLSAELPNLERYISEIEKPEHKAKLIIDLLPYVTPKYQSIDFGSETIMDGTIIRVIRETDQNIKEKNLPPWFHSNDIE
jgi:hypothetical protein